MPYITKNASPYTISLLVKGQRIQAIKNHRDEYGLDLKTAKDDIDVYARDMGMTTHRDCMACQGRGYVDYSMTHDEWVTKLKNNEI